MTASFYKETTSMAGVDMHPLDGANAEPHAVGSVYMASAYAGKRTQNVYADGWPMIQEGCSMMLIPHVAAPKTGLGVGRLITTIATSSSKAALAVHSVTGNGAPLACAISGPAGLNMNCNSPRSMPSGATLSLGTVMTHPTARDFALAAASTAWDWAWSWGSTKFFKRFDPNISKWSKESQEMAKLAQKALSKWGKSAFEKVVNPPKALQPYVNRVFE